MGLAKAGRAASGGWGAVGDAGGCTRRCQLDFAVSRSKLCGRWTAVAHLRIRTGFRGAGRVRDGLYGEKLRPLLLRAGRAVYVTLPTAT